MDKDKTPTKPRPVTRRACTLPTPPPSSPFKAGDIESTMGRMGLIRMKTDLSNASKEDSDQDSDLSKAKLNPYKRLKSFLRLSTSTSSSVDQAIVGREHEKTLLRSYLTSRQSRGTGMYVSGPPGTGKTALVTALGHEMNDHGWQVVELGCMGLKVNDVWQRLGEALKSGKTETEIQADLSARKIRT